MRMGFAQSSCESCIKLMGQNNSQSLQSRQHLRNWLTRDKDPNVLTNSLTHQQVHRHYIRILVKDLARETALFSTRMNNHQPYICRLLYFHPVSIEAKPSHDHQKDFREMFIYTDRFLHLKDWSRQKIILALHGLRRLISVHGPIRISEHMLCENEFGQIKVWISENPVNNHPDSKYMSEEQSMGDFAALLTKKNIALANLLIGCNTLKEASQKLSRTQREDSSPYQNYSHRASGSGSGEILKRKMEKEKSNMALYKNVFGDIHDSVKTKPETTTPKQSIKMFDHYPQSSFLPKEDESLTPTLHSNTLSRYREFVHVNKTGTPNEEKVHNKSIPKNIHASEAYLLGRRREGDARVNFRPSKINQNCVQGSQKGKELLSFTSSNVKSHEPARPFNFVHRFETVTNLSPTLNHFNSPKSRANPVWRSNQSSNLNISNIYDERQEAKSGFKEEKIKTNGYDITIINNNVNNYISNITHNHILKLEKTSSEQVHQFRTQTKIDEQNIHSSNQFPKKIKEKRFDVPVFLQQKKKAGEQIPLQQPFITKSKSNYNLNRKYTASSNPQEMSYESPQISSEKKVEISFDVSGKQRKQKMFHYNKNQDPMLNSHKTSTNSYPLSPNPSHPHFTSFQRASNNSFQFKAPLRTKTTEFYHKGRETKHEQPQHKSFTQNQLEKNTYLHKNQQKQEQIKETVPAKKLQRHESACATTTNSLEEPKQEQNKIQFKKQLRNQFKFLLSADQKQKEEEYTEARPPPQQAEKEQPKEAKEGNLKQKIMRKQIVFAELKKQAFELLQ